jgi:tetratricopeptide (TPR) repeat protein
MRNGFIMGALALALAGGAIARPQPPAAPGQAQPAQKTRRPKSKEEGQAVNAMLQAATPDARIAAAEDFVVKFPQSDFKALAYFAEAQGYQEKNDYDHLVVSGEQALESDPDDSTKVEDQLLLARAIALKTAEFDLDREEKLTKVEKYAGGAMDMLKTMSKPYPALPDAQWEAAKAELTAQGHEALGLDQMVRKDFEKAIAEFKAASDAIKGSEPSYAVRLAGAYDGAGKFDDALAVCDKLLAVPNLPPAVKRAAEAERARATKLKSSAPAAAKP